MVLLKRLTKGSGAMNKMKGGIIDGFVDKIIHQECLLGLKQIPDNSVDCCITSPPYWGLRDYGADGQLCQESDFRDFISSLIEIFDEVKRVLKPTGTCFVNLGDTYNGNKIGNSDLKNKSANVGAALRCANFEN